MDPATAEHAVNLTAILLSGLGTAFVVLRAVALYYIDKRVKDAQLRQVLENALQNGLGVIQQAASGAVVRADVKIMPGVIPDRLVPGVQYVLDHAGEALSHWGITPEAIADKLTARIGLKEIETNIAVTANPATPAIVPPLAPSPEGTTAEMLNRAELTRLAAAGVSP